MGRGEAALPAKRTSQRCSSEGACYTPSPHLFVLGPSSRLEASPILGVLVLKPY